MSSIQADETRRTLDKSHGRNFACRCGRPVFFRNSLCLGCAAPLGYEPGVRRVTAMDAGPDPGAWRTPGGGAGLFRRCDNFNSASGCNWLIPSTAFITAELVCRD